MIRRSATFLAAITVLLVGCGGGGVQGLADEPTRSAQTFTMPRPRPPAATTQPTTTPPAAPAGIGATVIIERAQYSDAMGKVTLNGAVRVLEAAGPPVLGRLPAEGSVIVIDVTVTTSAGELSPNPLSWEVQTADLRVYQAALGRAANEIDSSGLPAGQQVRGEIAFDVPNEPGVVTIRFQTPLGDTLAEFKITV